MDSKQDPHCLICNSRVAVSNRNAVEIFNVQNKLPSSEKTLAECISDFTGKKIEKQNAHSVNICKKCFKLLQEYDNYKSRVDEIKGELINQFKSTLIKNNMNYNSYPDAKAAGSSGISIKQEKPDKVDWLKGTNFKNISNISPAPSNLVIVGPKGKKITIQNATTISPMKVKSIKTESAKSTYQIPNDVEPEPSTADEGSTYLSEVDGMIIKTEKIASPIHDPVADDEFVFRELEIVDDEDGITEMPLEEGSIFMEQAEDGSIIRVVTGSNILQDEHGNFIYSTMDEDNIEMILPDGDDIQVQYREGGKKDEESNLEFEGNKESMDGIDMDEDSLEAQLAALKGADNLYTCLMCGVDGGDNPKIKSKADKANNGEEDENEAEEGNGDDSILIGDAALMMDHMKTIHNMDIYVCDHCGEVFLSREVLQEHIEEHLKASSGDHKCEICSKCFETEVMLKRHVKYLHVRLKPHLCTMCNKRFSTKTLLDHHTNVHKCVKPFCCHLCSKTFASKYTLQAHVKTHTDRPRPFTCSQCGKSFFTFPNLTQHEKTHLGIKNFECKVCGKCFGTQHNLEVHGVVHTGYKPFNCKTCGKSFARRAEIRDHERIHTGERPYFCEICGMKFSQRSNLQSHKRATHFNDKRYKCQLCDKCFKRRRLLDYHIKAAHTGERPFRCTICEASFVYPEHFKKHQKIHTGEKPYRCEVCNKAFNSRDNRNAHRYVHSDKKPYECLDCGAGFMRKPLLYAHMHSQGHLSDTIVVNQPRLGGDTDNEQLKTFVIESIKEEASPTKTKEGSKYSRNIPILSNNQSHNESADKGESILPDSIYLEDPDNTIDGDMLDPQSIEIIDGEHEVIQSEDGTIRIVQLKLADGENAWVALNDN